MNTGKPWVTFDRPTWWLTAYMLFALGFGIGFMWGRLS